MSFTALLPPPSAVRLTWARTGKLSDDPVSNTAATVAEAVLREIRDRADGDETERRYVANAIMSLDACFRSLDVIHKKRELNFADNEKLRSAFLESVRDYMAFGSKARDVLKSLPAMAIGGAAGGATVAQVFSLSNTALWLYGLGLAGVGYLVNVGLVRLYRRRQQNFFVIQDYERSVYFDQFISQVAAVLIDLYLDLDRMHQNAFGERYPVGDAGAVEIVESILGGVRPTFCRYVHSHIRDGRITPELWPICESGRPDAVASCPHWEGGRK